MTNDKWMGNWDSDEGVVGDEAGARLGRTRSDHTVG